ncbi:MAG: hypothetical protein COB66_07945 [Coxiella sp. (in: Bacteria)]|nr:MAG: hypothetical protein COB66_07945 [Coxiella sp. (in: g-proteobacteria)]
MSTVKKFKGHDVPEGAKYFREDCMSYHPLFVKNEGGYQYRIATPVSRHKWRRDAHEYDNLIELPQEPEAFVPVVGEWCAHVDGALWCKYGDLFYVGKCKAGFKVMHSEDGKLLEFGECAIFEPVRMERDNIRMWVESKIDCVEAFEMDQAILITKMLDLGCLVIPESDKC